MRFLDFVEQHNLIEAATDRFSQHTTFIITDIPRRCANKSRDRVLLHEFTHVDADHRLIIVEQEFRQSLGQLGLAHARWAQEQEAAKRAVRILQAGTRTSHSFGHSLDGLFLPDHALAEQLFHLQQLLALTLHHPFHRDAGPARHNACDIFFGHLFAQQSIL